MKELSVLKVTKNSYMIYINNRGLLITGIPKEVKDFKTQVSKISKLVDKIEAKLNYTLSQEEKDWLWRGY